MSSSSSGEEFGNPNKGQARSHKTSGPAVEFLLASGRDISAREARWPNSALLKESMLASLAIAGKLPAAATSTLSSTVSELRATSVGNVRMRGSLLSAASRIKLRDLANQARCAIASPAVNATSCAVSSNLSAVDTFVGGSGAGLLAASVSGATSTVDSGSRDYGSVPSSASGDTSASSRGDRSGAVDVAGAAFDTYGTNQVSSTSSDFAETMPPFIKPISEECSLLINDNKIGRAHV